MKPDAQRLRLGVRRIVMPRLAVHQLALSLSLSLSRESDRQTDCCPPALSLFLEKEREREAARLAVHQLSLSRERGTFSSPCGPPARHLADPP